jgi:hypothetical protein
MSQDEMHARHLVELGFLEEAITSLDMAAQLIEKSDQIDYHTLLVELEPDSQGRPRQLALNFYPVDESQLEDTLLLQYFVALPIELPETALPDIRQLLPDINNKVVLGHFGLTAGQPQLHFRYVQALPADDVITREKVANILTLVTYTPLLFQDVLEQVALGALAPVDALAKIQAIYSQP